MVDARVGRAWLALVRYTRHAPAALANAVAEGDDRVRGQAPIVPAEVVVACVAVVAWVRVGPGLAHVSHVVKNRRAEI